ncbi:MAG TPA: ankyrin repeat domain-containing protein [Paludibaculum sp.]|jgi:hypothetical protein
MKLAFAAGWICFAVELIFTAFLFISKNAGDDAAGRGVATGYGIVLLPLILIAGGLLYWGQGSSSRVLQWTALLVVALPFLVGWGLWVSNAVSDAGDRRRAASAGDFADARLTALAHAIATRDQGALATLLTQSGEIDWQARNRSDATLLGHAVRAVLDDYSGDQGVALVGMLMAHGAPLAGDPIRPGMPLLAAIMEGNTPGTVALLQLVLDAGADPNVRDRDGLPLIHITNSWHGLEKLKLLAAHGADLQARNNRRDRPQWSALMNAAYMQDWEPALFFLAHGVPPEYRAPDGNTLATVMAERAEKYAAYQETPPPGYLELQRAAGAWKPER